MNSNDDLPGSSASPPEPRRSDLRTDQARDDRNADFDESDSIEDEAIEGDVPTLEAIDTSRVTRSAVNSMQPADIADDDPLFGEDAAAAFQNRWDSIQRSFVDDPQRAVREGDELVTEVIGALQQIFSTQREQLATPDTAPNATEALRLALRRYRSFFERLLTI
jgi:hypothetical protein